MSKSNKNIFYYISQPFVFLFNALKYIFTGGPIKSVYSYFKNKKKLKQDAKNFELKGKDGTLFTPFKEENGVFVPFDLSVSPQGMTEFTKQDGKTIYMSRFPKYGVASLLVPVIDKYGLKHFVFAIQKRNKNAAQDVSRVHAIGGYIDEKDHTDTNGSMNATLDNAIKRETLEEARYHELNSGVTLEQFFVEGKIKNGSKNIERVALKEQNAFIDGNKVHFNNGTIINVNPNQYGYEYDGGDDADNIFIVEEKKLAAFYKDHEICMTEALKNVFRHSNILTAALNKPLFDIFNTNTPIEKKIDIVSEKTELDKLLAEYQITKLNSNTQKSAVIGA